MHDPDTVAFEIPSLCPSNIKKFLKYWLIDRKKIDNPFHTPYYESSFVIWHHDPSGYDSTTCGWGDVKLSKEQLEKIKKWSYSEYDFDVGRFKSLSNFDKLSPFEVVYMLWSKLKWQFFRKQKISHKELTRMIRLTASSGDNITNIIIALQKSNTIDYQEVERISKLKTKQGFWDMLKEEDWIFTKKQKEELEVSKELFYDLMRIIYKQYLAFHRPWYKHGKWHIHHWRIQWVFGQKLKSFFINKCNKCGKGFKWNDGVCSNSWNSQETKWWKSPTDIFHCSCDGQSDVACTDKNENSSC